LQIKAALKDSRLPKPKLALDCVSGAPAFSLLVIRNVSSACDQPKLALECVAGALPGVRHLLYDFFLVLTSPSWC
jgi:hypothetical protein